MNPISTTIIAGATAIGPLTWDGFATIIAAILATLGAVVGYSIQQRISRKERRAVVYSEALRAVEDYLEAPYLVRRRDGSASARQSITTRISDIQSRLSYYSALLEIHADSEINDTYRKLVSVARVEAGNEMSEAWNSLPTCRDHDVPISIRHDRSRTDEARHGFIDAIKRRER